MEEKNLDDNARRAIAERRYFGATPDNEINLMWNRMLMALEERDWAEFIKISKRVESLIRVRLKDNSHYVKRMLGVARYSVAKSEKRLDLATKALAMARDEADEYGLQFSESVRL